MTHLNDISKTYLEKISEKKDDSYLETDMKKRQKNNEKAIADMKKVKDDTVPRWMKEAKKLDPVGQEDADIDNDGDVDKSDKYLHKKRKAIGKAISKKMGEDEENNDEKVEESVVAKRKTLGSRFKNEAERQAYLKKLDQKSKEKKLNRLRATVEEVEEVELDEQGMGYRKTARGNYVSRDEPGERDSAEVRAHNRAVSAYLKRRKAQKESGKDKVEEAVYGGTPKKKEEPKDTRMMVTTADKKANTLAYQRYKAGDKRYKSADHLGEKVDVTKQSSKRKSLGRGSSINPDAKKTGYESPAEFRKTEKKLAPYMEAKNIHGEIEVPSGNIGKLAKKASKRIDTDVDGDVEHNDKQRGQYGEFIPTPDGKGKVFTGPKKVAKESFSNWRQDLIEIADEDGEKQIKEMPKNQKNKISINPKLGEAVEGIGGTLLEEVEIDELDVIINTIYDEFLEEGYTEDEIEEAFEVVLLDEANVTYGHDSKGIEPKKQSKLQGRMRYIKRKVGEKLSSLKSKAKEKYGMASAKAQVAAYNKARELSQKGSDVKNRAKTSLKRFVKNQAQKVVDRMSEEVEQIDEKAVSKKQQRFMGMVYAAKKGEVPASAEVAKAAAGMSKKDAKDFASTKHKKLPEVKESMQGEVQMTPQEVQLQRKSAQIDKKLAAIRLRKVQKQTSQQGQKTEG